MLIAAFEDTININDPAKAFQGILALCLVCSFSLVCIIYVTFSLSQFLSLQTRSTWSEFVKAGDEQNIKTDRGDNFKSLGDHTGDSNVR